jgi:pectin methylesterase-like acyl-CoA thioesterase
MEFVKSMVAVKTILNDVESTDSRLRKVFFDRDIDGYITILSGKVDTIFEVTDIIIKYLAEMYD